MTTIDYIEALRRRYYDALLGKEPLERLIIETEVSEQVYNSNAIENSTLSLEETEKILLQIDLDRYINERELFEAKNLARVVEYIHKKAIHEPLSLEIVLLLHKMLLSNICDDVAGRFRQGKEYVRVANHIASHPKDIVDELNEMLIEYNSNIQDSIIKKLAQFHLTFEHIHPFVDGNGRLGRVLNNFLLIREGYVPITIPFKYRSEYYAAFKEFDKENRTDIMEGILENALTNSYHKRLAYLEGKKIVSLNDYSKLKNLSHSNLINKANRQTIEAFTEKGEWKIALD